MPNRHLKIDLVTERPSDGAFILALVEEGPWEKNEIESHLYRIQDRLYDCVDAAIDGHLAKKLPVSLGRPVVIRLDCYDVPAKQVRDFVASFAEAIAASEEIQRDLAVQGFIQSVSFECNVRELKAE